MLEESIYTLKDKSLLNYLKDNNYITKKICCISVTSCFSMSYSFLQNAQDNNFIIIKDCAFNGGTSTNISNLESVYESLYATEKELIQFKNDIELEFSEKEKSNISFNSYEKKIKVLNNFIAQCLLLIKEKSYI